MTRLLSLLSLVVLAATATAAGAQPGTELSTITMDAVGGKSA